MKKRKAVVAGHTCLDITPVFYNKKVSAIQQVLRPGKLINVKGAAVYAGGTVPNTGLAMKKMGIETCLVGKVGTDSFGQMVQNIFKGYGADQDLIIDETVSTSYTIVVAVPGIDRVFLHNPGANDAFTWDDIGTEKLADADWFHFGYPPLMKKTFEDAGEELLRIYRNVKQKKIVTSLDMAAVDPEAEAGQADWLLILEKVLPYVDFFVPSVEELLYMVDIDKYNYLIKKAGDRDLTEILSTKDDIKPLVDQVRALGAKNVFLKCGAPGFYYRMAGRKEFEEIEENLQIDLSGWYDQEGFEKSYQPRQVASGTGAGDTTIAAFISALLQGYSFPQSMQAAAATGASCVETYDALSGILTIDEQLERVEQGWKKQDSDL